MSATVDAVRFELHCHSTCSDGSEAADQVATRAAERNVDVFALTDHDTCAGSAVTVSGARVLRAVEVTCDHEGRTIHVLAYDRGGAGWADLERKLADLREARRNRMRMMAAKLAQRGIRIDVEPLIADAERTGRTLGRPDLARLMVEHKAATSLRDAFARHLYDNGPVDVPTRALSLVDALSLGRAANAAMALAHPHLYDQLGVTLLKRHVGDGLRGVEAFYGVYDPRERKRWTELADDAGLVCTAGSDWHGPEEANAQIGVDIPDIRAGQLRDWLFDG